MTTATMKGTSLQRELAPNQIIHHAGRDSYYKVMNRCLMKGPNSSDWVDGLAYISAKRLGNGVYVTNMEDFAQGKVFVRALEKFDEDWAIIG